MSATTTVPQFMKLLERRGSVFTYHRANNANPCTCRTPQGWRDRLWHETDTPHYTGVTFSPGVLNGNYQYWFAHQYGQGEKFSEPNLIFGYRQFTDEQVTIRWNRAAVNPPSGQGPADGYALYRQHQPANPTDPITWKRLGIFSIDTLQFTDNLLDDDYPIEISPILHLCNEAGFIEDIDNKPVEFQAKGFIHPVQSGAVRRLPTEQILQMFGEVESDDHVGIVPLEWNGHTLDFSSWRESLEDWISYPSVSTERRFTVVGSNLIPDPANGQPHHWEVALRLI